MRYPPVVVRIPVADQGDSVFMFDYVFDGPQICIVGRADDCDIRILEGAGQREISPQHCLLEIDPPTVRLYDLGSANGTYVNGRRLEPIPDPTDLHYPAAGDLKNGDEVRIGDTPIQVMVAVEAFGTEVAQAHMV